MSEQFDASRPIYAQLVERLKAKILAGTYPPAATSIRCATLPRQRGSTPTRCSGAGPTGSRGLVRTERTNGRFVTEDTELIEQLRAEAARNMAAEFLEKMRSIGYTPQQTTELLERWNRNGGRTA